ncbi:hypothetical protein [Actinomadura sp. KC216]|uniref:hypothetical protein n=1 Tax=Actinomadura sp. KC216 TaxID=2530370 RepID=UPI001404B6C2|nr:hypothetical protein [Actinomadura sp. KC216]
MSEVTLIALTSSLSSSIRMVTRRVTFTSQVPSLQARTFVPSVARGDAGDEGDVGDEGGAVGVFAEGGRLAGAAPFPSLPHPARPAAAVTATNPAATRRR